jgi:hypothetical protein
MCFVTGEKFGGCTVKNKKGYHFVFSLHSSVKEKVRGMVV